MQADEWIIVANSPTIAFSALELQKIACERKMVALDGAANYLKKISWLPQVILGDFDSIDDKSYWGIKETFDEITINSEPYVGHFDVLIVPAKDQSHTDLEKAIIYCDKQGAKSLLIVNATGGRMDHTLGNIGLLRKYYSPTRSITIQTESESIQYLKDGSCTIKGKVGQACAIMGYPSARITTSGLTYDGEDYPIQLGIQESVCNSLAASQATIEVRGEALVIK